MKLLSLLLFFTFIAVSFPQKYQQVQIPISNPTDIQTITSLGIDLEGSELTKDNLLKLILSDQDLNLLTNSGFTYQVLIEDWQKYYDSLPKLNDAERQQVLAESKEKFNVTGFGYGSMGGYYTYDEIGKNLDSMYAHYPHLITQKTVIGTTIQNRPIWSVKISDNPNVSEDEARSGFDALIHAREPASMSTLMYFMWYLLENYGTDPEVTYLVNNREIFCSPVFNPDGYEKNRSTNPNGGGMWRKNYSLNGGSYGVDLNRNFTYKWAYDNVGSSGTPSSETYRGPSAGSELEVQASMNFIKPRNIKTYLNMHAYQNAFLYPWGYADIPIPAPDMAKYVEFCNDMTALNGFEYGTGSQILGYNSNGASRDWYYGEVTLKNKIFGYTMEIGSSSDNFWPPQARIFPIAQQSVKALMYNAFVAGDYVKLKYVAYNKPYIAPGDTVAATPWYRNKGLSTSKQHLTVTATSMSSYVTFVDNGTWIDSLSPGTEAAAYFPVGLIISPSCPAGLKVKIVYELKDNTMLVTRDTVSFITGVRSYSFIDTTNNPLLLWTVTATPTTSPKWEATTTTFNSAPNSYTDSKTGNYVGNATVTMTMTNQLDLALPSNPYLTFWTRYDLESGWDYSQVEISTNNGTTWTALQGSYTKPGSGTFQPAGQPLYNGTRTSWVQEEMDLTAYNNKSIKLRYKLRSDGSTHKDGWYVDDIGIYYYGATPVELTSFTASAVGDAVVLNWQTASELNNKGFEVQKLNINNNSGWSTLAFINGNGTTTEANKYQYIDKTEAGKYYYRIKQIDFDGSSRIYNQVEVDFNVQLSYSLSANYPNPFNPATVIKYSVPEKGNVELAVYDILGNKAASLVNEVKEPGSYAVNFNAANLSSGVYFYTIKAGNFTKTMKMLYLK